MGFGAGATLLAVAPQAHAQRPGEWEIHSRIQQAQERINHNVGRGNLSRHEAKRLEKELNEIRRTEARMRKDGRLDRREREILDHKLDRLNREINLDKRR
jgi:polyhydroxyalkanoate synthesis regulator phasin